MREARAGLASPSIQRLLRLVRGLGCAAMCITLFATAPAYAQRFETRAKHALLMDADTETILFQKAADERMPPASMAKLMTMAVVFEALKSGRLSLDTEFQVSRERVAQRRSQLRRLDDVRQARLDHQDFGPHARQSSSSPATTPASPSPKAWPAPNRLSPT